MFTTRSLVTFLLVARISFLSLCQDSTLITIFDSTAFSTELKEQAYRYYQETGALVSYYFWKEDADGYIVKNEIHQPFLQNYYIRCIEGEKQENQLSYLILETLIANYAHEISHKDEKTSFTLEHEKHIVKCPLVREQALQPGSVIHIEKNGKWQSIKAKSVLYFSISENNRWKYTGSSDTILMIKNEVIFPSNGQYTVLTYDKAARSSETQRIYSYSGIEVTKDLLEKKSCYPQRLLVFANGYRGPTKNKDVSDHIVTQKDRYHYWFKIDNQFINLFQPAAAYYIDGSMPIRTSTHQTMGKFMLSFIRSTCLLRKKRAANNYKALNTEVNKEGFALRKEKGKIAGRAFLAAVYNSPLCEGVKDTLDIVCHSMGYAYSLGFIEEIKDKVILGKMYILSPEDAAVDGADWLLFDQVWQYGSNLDQENPDPVWQQDGIAPQSAVKGIENLPPNKGGRAFIPKDWHRKNFIDSHQLYNYDWIFERIKVGEAGYICR